MCHPLCRAPIFGAFAVPFVKRVTQDCKQKHVRKQPACTLRGHPAQPKPLSSALRCHGLLGTNFGRCAFDPLVQPVSSTSGMKQGFFSNAHGVSACASKVWCPRFCTCCQTGAATDGYSGVWHRLPCEKVEADGRRYRRIQTYIKLISSRLGHETNKSN